MPPDVRREAISELAPLLNDPVLKQVFDFLVARKDAEFASIRRMILDYEVRQNGDSFALSVVSTLT
jgi:hypothetical protein